LLLYPLFNFVVRLGPAGGGLVPSATQPGPAPEASPALPGPNQEPALRLPRHSRAKLGLKLEAKRPPAEMLIVDKIEKTPTEN
jgi:uncharacterized protein (TIGR03435 family)